VATEDDVRQVALSLPGSAERPDNRLPSFRMGGKLFLRIHELPDVFFERCAGLEEHDELLKSEPGKLSSRRTTQATRGSWSGSARLIPCEMAEIVTDAWRACAPNRLLAAHEAGHPPAP
jgi:hypothetical protein